MKSSLIRICVIFLIWDRLERNGYAKNFYHGVAICFTDF